MAVDRPIRCLHCSSRIGPPPHCRFTVFWQWRLFSSPGFGVTQQPPRGRTRAVRWCYLGGPTTKLTRSLKVGTAVGVGTAAGAHRVLPGPQQRRRSAEPALLPGRRDSRCDSPRRRQRDGGNTQHQQPTNSNVGTLPANSQATARRHRWRARQDGRTARCGESRCARGGRQRESGARGGAAPVGLGRQVPPVG